MAGRRDGTGLQVPIGAAALLVLLLAAGCGIRPTGRDLYPEFARFSGANIRDVNFRGTEPFGRDTLQSYVDTRPTRCRFLGLPLCLPFTRIGREEHRLSLETLRRDSERLAQFYRRAGYFATSVRPAVEPAGNDNVVVTFFIMRGDPIYLEEFTVEGIEDVLPPDFTRRLPIEEGDIFDLGAFAVAAERIEGALLRRGHAYAEVLRNYTVDIAGRRATAQLVAVPGPQVYVDSIIVVGAHNLGRRAALRQLTFGTDELLRRDRLVDSQRNLYNLELVQLATVEVAADTLQADPADRSRATVVVTVEEAPVHVVEAAAGYGSVDCFRSDARWVSRSFLGGARRLSMTGSVSKVGIAQPVDLGFEGNICRAYRRDPFRRDLDYRFAGELNQPWFISPRNNLSATLFSERQSEPAIFQREAHGAGASILHRLDPRSGLTGSIDFVRGRTLASEVIFCLTLQLCLPEDIRQLRERRWRNTLGTSWFRDRTDDRLEPTRGYDARTAVTLAAGFLGSEVTFQRWTGDAALYRSLQPAWIAAFRLRAGTVFGAGVAAPGSDFLPPEERFYAGGATTVRGFERNALGPGVYVTRRVTTDPVTGRRIVPGDARIQFVPVGGSSLIVGNAELRLPSPFLSDMLRWVVFLDGGAVGAARVRDLGGGDFRYTPGLGVRIQTPVGPARIDVGYSPYGPPRAPLLVPNPDEEQGGFIRFLDEYRPETGFWGRFRVHLAVGHAF
jgi:outer membrane protein assembly complex protein YaeT